MDKSTGPDLIIWTDAFSVQQPEMDQQHQKIIGMVNRLFKAFILKTEDTTAAAIVQELADYTVYHFAAETALLQRLGFPELPRHLNLHTQMAEKTRRFAETFEASQAEVMRELLDMLKAWWTGHILREDRKYAQWLQTELPAGAESAPPGLAVSGGEKGGK
jgi:hemerythrin